MVFEQLGRFWKKGFQLGSRKGRSPAQKGSPRYRPSLESLEERLALAQMAYVTGPGDPLGAVENEGFFQGHGITSDPDGNTYMAGTFTNTVDFDPGSGEAFMTSVGSSDVFVSKFDALGQFLWTRQLGGEDVVIDFGYFQRSLTEEVASIAVDPAGNVVVVGSFPGTMDADPDAAIEFPLTSQEDYDVFVVKLDSSGDFSWARSYGGTGYEKAQDVGVDGAGNVYFIGWYQASIPNEGFVVKLDPAGDESWLHALGIQNAGTQAIAVDHSGNVYVTATAYYEQEIDGTVFSRFSLYLSKRDTEGNLLWALGMLPDFPSTIFAQDIVVDSAGDVLVAGYFSGTVYFGPEVDSPFTLISGPSEDVFVAKFRGGNVVWATKLGTDEQDFARAISVDAVGNAYVVWDGFPTSSVAKLAANGSPLGQTLQFSSLAINDIVAKPGGLICATGTDFVSVIDTDSFTNSNHAPVLDSTGDPAFPGIDEDPSANPGTRVVDLLASVAGLDMITDTDADPEGIAIVSADSKNGAWQYTTDGTAWLPLGDVDGNSARLLLADALTALRFVPRADYNGIVPLTFRAWDGSDGRSNGSMGDASAVGGSNAFSAAAETANLSVQAINDKPVIARPGKQTLVHDQSFTFSRSRRNAITVTDVDAGAARVRVVLTGNRVTINLATMVGLVNIRGNGSSMVQFDGPLTAINNALNDLVVTPFSRYVGKGGLTVAVDDLGNTGGDAQQTSATIDLDITNRAPTWNGRNLSYIVGVKSTLSVNAANGILSVFTDPDGDRLTAVLVSPPSAGSLILNQDGSFTYRPTLNRKGMDSFRVKVTDGLLESSTITVTLRLFG